jgi:hypothetical protein
MNLLGKNINTIHTRSKAVADTNEVSLHIDTEKTKYIFTSYQLNVLYVFCTYVKFSLSPYKMNTD